MVQEHQVKAQMVELVVETTQVQVVEEVENLNQVDMVDTMASGMFYSMQKLQTFIDCVLVLVVRIMKKSVIMC